MSLLEDVFRAQLRLRSWVAHTPLLRNTNFSSRFSAAVWIKREDLQAVRSYKLRGAYNKILSLLDDCAQSEHCPEMVCASAGNHAQGVAYACNQLGLAATIFMPVNTPRQKIAQVRRFGNAGLQVLLVGDRFDDAYVAALRYTSDHKASLVHPFDDEAVIAGQGTVALEILEAAPTPIDYVFIPVGGGGLAAGIATGFRELSPRTRLIGVEPLGAPAMKTSIANGFNTTLDAIDTFIDGAAVSRVGDLTFEICRKALDDIVLIPEGKVCSTILQLYNEEAIVAEPAGALALSALDFYKAEIKGKKVVCILSGGNNDIDRIEEIKRRAAEYKRDRLSQIEMFRYTNRKR